MAVVKDREELGNSQLWQIMVYQEGLIAERFGIGLVGIGALFLAYATATADNPLPHLPEVIAFAGAGASFILWMHMYGAHKEAVAFRDLLSCRDQVFMDAVHQARKWRSTGWNLLVYQPVNRLMTYFTALLTEAWIIIILWRRGVFALWGISYDTLFWGHVVLFLVVLVWYVGERRQDRDKNREEAECGHRETTEYDHREGRQPHDSKPISANDNRISISGNTFVAAPASRAPQRGRKPK